MASFSEPMTFGGGGAVDEEQQSMMGRVSDLAAGLKHPVCAFFHLFFKVRSHASRARAPPFQPPPPLPRATPATLATRAQTMAVLTYLFGGVVSGSFVNNFVLCVLLLAFDFWTVKNVSGRLMVGLRWWSETQDDGNTVWRYEAQEEGLNSTQLDVLVFWSGLFAPLLVWFVFGVGSLFRMKFDWLMLIITALTLSGANALGYVRCKQDARGKIGGALTALAAKTGMSKAVQGAAHQAFGF